jgi:hypothetical protein
MVPLIRAASGFPKITSIHLGSIGSKSSLGTVLSSAAVAELMTDQANKSVGVIRCPDINFFSVKMTMAIFLGIPKTSIVYGILGCASIEA